MARLARRLGLAGAVVLATLAPALHPAVSLAAPGDAGDRSERGEGGEAGEAGQRAELEDGATSEAASEEDDAMEVIRVQGLRERRYIDAPSAFVTHIDPSDFANEGKTVDDLLSEQAGVQVRRFGGAGEPATLSIRGSSAEQVELSLNGVRLNSPLSGGADVSELCLGMVDGIDIERGGRSAIGGRVDLSSPIATGRRVARASGEAASFGTWRGSAFLADRVGSRDTGRFGFDLALGYCGFKTDGDYVFARPIQDNGDQIVPYDPPQTVRINNDQQKHTGQVGLGFELGDRQRIDLRDYVSWQDGGVPGLDSGDGVLAGQDTNARLEYLQNVAHLEWSAEEMGWAGDQLSVGLYHRYQHDDYDDPAEPASVIPDRAVVTKIHTGGLMTEQSWERPGLGGRQRIEVAFDGHRDAAYVTDDGVEDERARTSLQGDVTLESGYLAERLVVASGFTAAWSQGFDPAFLPSLGLVVTPLRWLVFKTNGYASWRVPSFDELYLPDRGFIRGNPDLQPERAWGVDGGFDLVFDALPQSSSIRFSARAFYQKRRDEIVWTQVSPWVVQPVNLDATHVLGLESSFRAEWSRWAGLALTHTEIDSELEGSGRGVPGRAKRESSVRLRVGPKDAWKLVGEWLYTGEIPASQDGRVILPARGVLNLTAAADLAALAPLAPLRLDRAFGALWTTFAVDNVCDVAVRDGLFAPQPGRSFTIGLETRW